MCGNTCSIDQQFKPFHSVELHYMWTNPDVVQPRTTYTTETPQRQGNNVVMLLSSSIYLQNTCNAIVIRKVMRICLHCSLPHVHIISSQVRVVKDT